LNAVVAQRGASVGIIVVSKKQKSWRYGSRSARPASIANGVPFAAETGEPVPLLGLQEKGWRHLRPPFHIGRAVPADFSAFAATQAEASFLGNFKKAGVFFEKKVR